MVVTELSRRTGGEVYITPDGERLHKILHPDF